MGQRRLKKLNKEERMTNRTKIILAIVGGALVGGLGTCGIIFPQFAILTTSAAALVALAIPIITGYNVTR